MLILINFEVYLHCIPRQASASNSTGDCLAELLRMDVCLTFSNYEHFDNPYDLQLRRRESFLHDLKLLTTPPMIERVLERSLYNTVQKDLRQQFHKLFDGDRVKAALAITPAVRSLSNVMQLLCDKAKHHEPFAEALKVSSIRFA